MEQQLDATCAAFLQETFGVVWLCKAELQSCCASLRRQDSMDTVSLITFDKKTCATGAGLQATSRLQQSKIWASNDLTLTLTHGTVCPFCFGKCCKAGLCHDKVALLS